MGFKCATVTGLSMSSNGREGETNQCAHITHTHCVHFKCWSYYQKYVYTSTKYKSI